VPFRVDRALASLRAVNPDLDVLFTAATAPDGVEEWYRFLRAQLGRRRAA
jgi:Ni2+-binding GTPase involved in maturation of urease and hydrogenase